MDLLGFPFAPSAFRSATGSASWWRPSAPLRNLGDLNKDKQKRRLAFVSQFAHFPSFYILHGLFSSVYHTPMAISSVGSARFKVYGKCPPMPHISYSVATGVLLLVNTVVLALSAHINHFQEFFCACPLRHAAAHQPPARFAQTRRTCSRSRFPY